jgi:hypothetical protein
MAMTVHLKIKASAGEAALQGCRCACDDAHTMFVTL